ncbi:glycosyltransferase [Cupriavidus oxalaticus]|uniref:glycosyltransferase n=1 Tax=Cupriavidus oxalaticus TaxID=96344 RepID=UPI0031815E9B
MIKEDPQATYSLAKIANAAYREGNYARAIEAYRKLVVDHDRVHFVDNIKWSHSRWSEGTSIGAAAEWRPSLLFVTAGLKGPTAGGGIATCFFNMIAAVASEGNAQVTVLYAAHPYYSKGNFAHWEKVLREEHGVKFIGLGTNLKDYGSVEMKRSYAISRFLEQRDGAFDKVIFHDFGGLAFYSAVAKRQGLMLQNTDLVISAHGNHELSYFFGSKKVQTWSESAVMYMERSSLRLADRVFTPSQYYADWFKEKFGINGIHIQPNIISKADPAAGDKPISLPTDAKKDTVVFYGRFERLKGIDVFMDAIDTLKNTGKDFNVVFAGNGTKIDGVDAKDYVCERLGAIGVVPHFVFDTKPALIFDFARRVKGLCVFPTLGETSSCVVVESILESVDFVVSDIPGIKELVADEHHADVFCKAGDHTDLAARIDSHFSSRSNRKPARLSFDMDDNRREWIDLLTRVDYSHLADTSDISSGPLVSVVIPTADRPELLKQALDSIARQSYQDVEIIVVDDNSEAAELNANICKEYGAKYLKLDDKRYKGAACNFGVEHARGTLICFFDDDDLADVKMLSTYVRTFARQPDVDVLSCFAGVFEHANQKGVQLPSVEYASLALGGNNETNFACNFFGKGTFIIRAEKFRAVGGYEIDFGAVPMVDYRFYIKAALKGLKIAIVPRVLYLYRKNSPNSLFYSKTGQKRMMYLAKHGVQKVFMDHFGEEMGRAFVPHIWNIGQPKYE